MLDMYFHLQLARVYDTQLFFRLYENKGEADFRESLLQLFKSINEMMSSISDQTVIVKVCGGLQLGFIFAS